MRRALSGILIVAVLFSAVGFSDGPLRRLFFLNRSVEVTRKVCTGPNCPKVQTYATPQAYPSRLADGSEVTSVRVFPTTVTGTQRPVRIITVNDPPTRSLPATPIVAQTQITPATPEPTLAPRLTSTSMSDHFVETEATDGFRRALIKASRAAAKAGTITRRDALKIRVALFSPAFREQAQELCVVQMAFSGDGAVDDLPRKASGEIDQAAIDWDGFASFLERILPLILDLLIAFGVGA